MSNEKNTETKLLTNIINARNIIRKKMRQLKIQNMEESEQLEKFYEPITKPLKTILINRKNGEPLKTENTNLDDKVKEDIKNEAMESSSDNYESADDLNKTIMGEPPELNSTMSTRHATHKQIINQYIDGLIKHDKTFDVKTGPKYNVDNKELTIGSEIAHLEGRNFIISSKKYLASHGLLELLFKKSPHGYTNKDLTIYKNIILRTNLFRRKNDINGQIIGSKSIKYRHIVSKLITSSSNKNVNDYTGTSLMDLDSKLHQYVYWNDINELVDRLKLLWASKMAGNTSHTNEIQSILEELHEAKVIQFI